MKKTLITLIIITYSLLSFGQKVDFRGGSVSLPDGIEKIDKNEGRRHVANKFRNNRLADQIVSGANAKNIYRIGDVIVILNSQEHIIKEGHFATIKRSFDNMFRNDPTYKSQLKSVDGNIIFTMDHQTGGVGYYSVFANDASNSKIFSAMIQYNTSDINKASKIADHIIKNIKFSN
ncbi:MAG: hypothetical protein ABI367_05740 [Mucilaginibacter sp.]